MAPRWSPREYEVAGQVMKAGCPLEMPPNPADRSRFEVTAVFGTLNQIIDIDPYGTGYALELLIGDNQPGEFAIENVGLLLPWQTNPLEWFEDPSDWKDITELQQLRRGYRDLTSRDLLKLPYKMRRGNVLRRVLVGVSHNPIPEDFLGVYLVPARVILEDYWGRQQSGAISLEIFQSKAARLRRQPRKQEVAKSRQSLFAENSHSSRASLKTNGVKAGQAGSSERKATPDILVSA